MMLKIPTFGSLTLAHGLNSQKDKSHLDFFKSFEIIDVYKSREVDIPTTVLPYFLHIY